MPTFNRSFSGGGSRAVVTDLEVDPSDSTVSVDHVNNRVGIGTTAPGTTLELEGEVPYITLKNSTAENTDGGCETKLIFEDHAAASLGQIEVSHSGSADDTKGKMILSTHTGSSLNPAVTIDDTQKASFSGNVDITGGLSFDAGTAVTSIDTDISSVSGSDDTLASAKAIKTYVDAQTTDLASEVTGTLPVANGGTGATSLADNSVLTGTGTSAVTAESKLTFDGTTLLVDSDVTATSTHTTVGAHIDYDATGIIATGQTGTNVGLDVDLNSDSPTMVGTVNNTGLDIDLTGGTSGTQKNVGIDVNVTGADTNYAAVLNGGNVGIGTSVPGDMLHVAGSDAYVVLQNTTDEHGDGQAETRIKFFDHAGNGLAQIEGSHSGSSDDDKGKLIFSTNNDSGLQTALTIDDTQKLTAAGDVQVTGDIILDDGGSLKEAGGTAAITFDGDGHVTKIGQDSPSSGQFLKYDGAKWVADTVSGTVAGSVAADDISAGDAAINLTTTTGNITIDAQAGDADIIFKGTDGSSDITALTLDMSEAGAAAFNSAVSVGTDLTVTGGDIAFGATNSSVTVGATAHDAAGANLTISAGPTTAGTSNNQAGGSLTISGGQGKGTGAGGDIVFKTANAGASGSSLNSLATALTIDQTRKATFATASTNAIVIDQDYSITSSSNLVGLDIDIDKTGASGSGSNNSIIGINLDMDNTSATDGTNTMTGMKVTPTLIHAADAGTTLAKGIEVVVTGGTPGGSTARALDLTATGADFNQGIYMSIADGGPDIKMVSSADVADSATIATGANGALTITTTDGGAAAADLTLEIDGDILLNSEEGKWRFKKGLGGSASGRLKIDESNSGDVQIELAQADKKLEFKGTDDASGITALELDMALAGKATFSGGVVSTAASNTLGATSFNDANITNVGDIALDSISADGTTIDINCDTVTFDSSSSEDPLVIIKNTTNDANGARLRFVKDKGAAGADGDDIGVIEFVGDDSAQAQTSFAKIVAEVSEADDSDEAGKLSFFVAESDGTTTALTAGLVIEGEHATDGQVNVTLGAGVQSVTNTSGKFGVFDTTPMTAINVVNNYNTVTFENQLASGEGGGRVMRYSPGADDTLTVGRLYFLHTDGTWDETDADAVATGATQLLGIGLGNARTAGCLMEGFIRIPSTEIEGTPGSGAVDGLPLYVSTTAGHITFTRPSGAGDFVRIVGHAIDDHSNDVLIYFNPSNNHVEL